MSLRGASPAQCASAIIVTAMLATGCASDPGGQASQSGETPREPVSTSATGDHQHRSGKAGEAGSAATASSSADVVVEASVQDGAVSPSPRRVRVQEGQAVRLVVRSDHEDAVHVHGYGREQPVSPGNPAVLTFTADTTGVFEVETHDPALQLLQLQVR